MKQGKVYPQGVGWRDTLRRVGTVSKDTPYSAEEMEAAATTAAEEGAVLLKNENNALPLTANDTVAVFGSRQLFEKAFSKYGYLAGGAGSGAAWSGLKSYPVDILKQKADEGKFTFYAPISDAYRAEPEAYVPSDADLAAAKDAGVNKAIYILSRLEGEGGTEEIFLGKEARPDNAREPGEWYLSEEEETIIKRLHATFDQVIVVTNTGNLMDTNWVKDGIDGEQVADAVLFAWYGGRFSSEALANLLCGDATPSGKLSQTAAPIENYPTTEGFDTVEYTNYTEDIFVGYRYFETFNVPVNYEFGYGLSYTTFGLWGEMCEIGDTDICINVTVSNTGTRAGKEVVQVYFSAPQMGTGDAKLGKPAKELAGFAKSPLLQPGESAVVNVKFPIADMASYDDTGVTGNKAAWVLEAGDYQLYMGTSVKEVRPVAVYTQKELLITEQLQNKAQSPDLDKRLLADGSYETLTPPTLDEFEPDEFDYEEDDPVVYPDGIVTFDDVKEGKKTLNELVAQFTIDELASFTTRTEHDGAAQRSCIGGNESATEKYKVPIAGNCDGPLGPDTGTWSFPSSALLGCSFNLDLPANLGTISAKYLKKYDRPIFWLAPGMNIQRNPLGGRNFEYYSEDPLVTGLMAAATTVRSQELGLLVTGKHLAANNKELNRGRNDSRISERALREIYLKGFEIAIKEGKMASLMTGYNWCNGRKMTTFRDMLVGIIREEWGWDGMYMTDWDSVGQATAIVSLYGGMNIFMGGSQALNSYDTVLDAYEDGNLTREMLETNAKYVIRAILRAYVPNFERKRR